MASFEGTKKEDERKKPTIPQIKRLESKEEWISEEELYTEGSSDEEDTALRIKRRERRGEVRKKLEAAARLKEQHKAPSGESQDEKTTEQKDETRLTCAGDGRQDTPVEQEEEDDSYIWRPTQGSFKLKLRADSEEKPSTKIPAEWASLEKEYKCMNKMDKLIKDSDQKVKEAQAETLRAQLVTRAQLKRLYEQQGTIDTPLARNLEAFIKLCPLSATYDESRLLDRSRAGRRGLLNEASEEDGSVKCMLSSVAVSDSNETGGECHEDDDLSGNAFADDEKIKLAELLSDIDDPEQSKDYDDGYELDPDSLRALEDIDRQLRDLDLAMEMDVDPDSQPSIQEDSAASQTGYRRRLDEIEKALKMLAAADLEAKPLADGQLGEEPPHETPSFDGKSRPNSLSGTTLN